MTVLVFSFVNNKDVLKFKKGEHGVGFSKVFTLLKCIFLEI